MRIVSKKRLRQFWEKHPAAEMSLRGWYGVVKGKHWDTFADVRKTFNSVDLYERCHIFNVGGNKYRIIAAIHYNTQTVFIRHVLSHEEYSRGTWKRSCTDS